MNSELEIGLIEDTFADYPDVVTIEQVREMLNIGRNLAYRLIKSGEIRARKVGRSYRIFKASVIEYMCRQSVIAR